MKVSIVQRPDINVIWPKVEKMLAKSLDMMPGRYASADIFIGLLKGDEALWVCFDEETNDIKAAITTRIYDVPLGRICRMVFGGGEDAGEWEEEFMKLVEDYASNFGCSRIEGYGRLGWKKYAGKNGYKMVAAIYDKELSVPDRDDSAVEGK